MKTISAATLIGILFTFGTAQAQEMMDCTDDAMMKIQADVDAITDAAQNEQKEMAMKELEKAKEAKTANSEEDCKMHLANAAKAMKKS